MDARCTSFELTLFSAITFRWCGFGVAFRRSVGLSELIKAALLRADLFSDEELFLKCDGLEVIGLLGEVDY